MNFCNLSLCRASCGPVKTFSKLHHSVRSLPILLLSPFPFRGAGPASRCEGFLSLHTSASSPLDLTGVTPHTSGHFELCIEGQKFSLTCFIRPAIKLLLGELSEIPRCSEVSSKTHHGSSGVRPCSDPHSGGISVFTSHFPVPVQNPSTPREARGRLCSSPCPWWD